MSALTKHCATLHFPSHYQSLFPIIGELKKQNATCYLVGGAVRDAVVGLPIKDIDIEVHGIEASDLQVVLARYGDVLIVGKQFGVLRLASLAVDWSLPRADSCGRKPIVTIDHTLSIEQSCRRRDVTMNAMAINITLLHDQLSQGNVVSAEVIDPFGGINDLKANVMRVVDRELFIQDPLRFYRVMQFVARFSLQPDEQLNQLCAEMALRDSMTGKAVAKERVYEELKKMLLKSATPSLGFRWLRTIGRLHDTFPELHDTIGVEQRSDFHPEGDVFEHTMQALDAVASIDHLIDKGRIVRSADEALTHTVSLHRSRLLARYKDLSCDDEKFMLMLAVLCHDFGKVDTTEKISETEIRSWHHEKAGVPRAERFLRRFTDDYALITTVKKLVLFHMHPSQLLHNNAPLSAYKKVAFLVYPYTTLSHLSIVYYADLCGRNGKGHHPLSRPQSLHGYGYAAFVAKAEEAGVLSFPEEPLLKGDDICKHIPPGPVIGKLLHEAYLFQITKSITDKEVLERFVLSRIKKNGP